MKLRNLSGAIRKVDGPVYVTLHSGAGVLRVPVQKTALINALQASPLAATDETGMELDGDTLLGWHDGGGHDPSEDFRELTGHGTVATLLPIVEQIDLEDLTGTARPEHERLRVLADDLAGLL